VKRRVAIVFGGNSVEHEISILSMIQASHAIDRDRYEVVPIYITKDGEFWVGPGFDDLETFKKQRIRHYRVAPYRKKGRLMLKGLRPFLPWKYRKPIDVVLPVVHGNNVEDGSLAGVFTILNVPYAGSQILPAALLQNKHYSKLFLERSGFTVVPYQHFRLKDYKKDVFAVLEKSSELGYPLIIKPTSLGSSIGIKIAENRDQLIKALNYVSKYDDEIIVEKKLENFRELNQAVLRAGGEYVLSAIEEVKSDSAFLSFSAKYLPGESRREIPAVLPPEIAEKVNTESEAIAAMFQVRGVARIDYLYDNDSGTLYVNEINTIPGSLAFYLFEEKIPFSELVERMLEQALRDKYDQDRKTTSFPSNVLFAGNRLKK
jgi:D-alanine-D-alanine ligase